MRWHMIRKTFPTKEKFVGLDIHLSDICLICWLLEVCENFDTKLFSMSYNMILHETLKYKGQFCSLYSLFNIELDVFVESLRG